MNRRLLAAFLSLTCTGSAEFMRPDWVPVDRLLENIGRYVMAHPSEASGYYALGRLHYLAFALKMGVVPAFPQTKDELARPAPDFLVGLPLTNAREQHAIDLARQEFGEKADAPDQRTNFFQAVTRYHAKLVAENWAPPEPTPETLISHAAKAAAAFRKALELDAKDPLFPLGLGSLLVQFADWNDEARVKELPPELQGDLRTAARGNFLRAWKMAYPTESKVKSLPIGGLSELASFEAGHAFLRLAEAAPRSLSPEEKAAATRMKSGVAALEKLPMGAITPLVLSLHPTRHLSELLQAEAAVEFDLTGFGLPQRWTWISPKAGLLVWDPLDRREIRSGRQLFGNFSFQGMWRNGFDALRALDDNGDGQVADSELLGLAVWFDRNGDGRSIPSEVIPLNQLGIRALRCEPSGHDGVHPVSQEGVLFRDGHTLPLWDWIAEPARSAHPG